MRAICTREGVPVGLFTGGDSLVADMEGNNPGMVCFPTKLLDLPLGQLYAPETDSLSPNPNYVSPDVEPPAPPPTSPEQVQAAIIAATQKRLDDFARTRNYDGILSACTYAASAIAKFAAEGQYALYARDLTWAALYAIVADVQSGTRPVPSGYADVEADLPELVWPEEVAQ